MASLHYAVTYGDYTQCAAISPTIRRQLVDIWHCARLAHQQPLSGCVGPRSHAVTMKDFEGVVVPEQACILHSESDTYKHCHTLIANYGITCRCFGCIGSSY